MVERTIQDMAEFMVEILERETKVETVLKRHGIETREKDREGGPPPDYCFTVFHKDANGRGVHPTDFYSHINQHCLGEHIIAHPAANFQADGITGESLDSLGLSYFIATYSYGDDSINRYYGFLPEFGDDFRKIMEKLRGRLEVVSVGQRSIGEREYDRWVRHRQSIIRQSRNSSFPTAIYPVGGPPSQFREPWETPPGIPGPTERMKGRYLRGDHGSIYVNLTEPYFDPGVGDGGAWVDPMFSPMLPGGGG